MYRIDFDDVLKRLQFVSSRLVSKQLCMEMTEIRKSMTFPFAVVAMLRHWKRRRGSNPTHPTRQLRRVINLMLNSLQIVLRFGRKDSLVRATCVAGSC